MRHHRKSGNRLNHPFVNGLLGLPNGRLVNVGGVSTLKWPAVLALLYWAVFWTFNGLDKFLNGGTDLGLLHWHGKDRDSQFGGYFANVGIPEGWVTPVLWFAGAWELAVGGLFVATFVRPAAQRVMTLGFTMAALSLTAFSAFDIVAGDRRELFEHGLYMAILLLSWQAVSSWPPSSVPPPGA